MVADYPPTSILFVHLKALKTLHFLLIIEQYKINPFKIDYSSQLTRVVLRFQNGVLKRNVNGSFSKHKCNLQNASIGDYSCYFVNYVPGLKL